MRIRSKIHYFCGLSASIFRHLVNLIFKMFEIVVRVRADIKKGIGQLALITFALVLFVRKTE